MLGWFGRSREAVFGGVPVGLDCVRLRGGSRAASLEATVLGVGCG